MCCCAKTRKEGEGDTLRGIESKLKSAQMILLEFIKEESNLKMKEIGWAELSSKIYPI
jgi:hypothetical protein